MIVVVAAIDYENQEARDAAIAASADVQMATRNEERGCRDYCFAPDPGIPTRIQVYELWDDGPSLVEHFKHKNYDDMRGALRAGGTPVASVNRAYNVDEGIPVYHEDGSARTSFFED